MLNYTFVALSILAIWLLFAISMYKLVKTEIKRSNEKSKELENTLNVLVKELEALLMQDLELIKTAYGINDQEIIESHFVN